MYSYCPGHRQGWVKVKGAGVEFLKVTNAAHGTTFLLW